LQRSGTILAAIGWSQAGLSLLGDRYSIALAQSSPRKLALLVGINQYPVDTPLKGCITDVELQQELLIYRFGFYPDDILTLTDQQATRQNIENAFVEHLSKQVKPGDVVLFHFSGYGTRVNKTNVHSSKEEPSITNVLLPVDSVLPTKNQPVVNAVSQDTLFLLLRSLPTDLVTTVLDTSYTDGGIILQGNLRVRSKPLAPTAEITAEEIAFQAQITQNSPQISPNPGIVLVAAEPEQLATEGQLDGFSSGFFTYALTQHLWQATPATTIQVSLSQVAATVEQLVGNKQQPKLCGKSNQDQTLLTYHLSPEQIMGADGVVIGIEENTKIAQLWLAGLPAKVLQLSGINSLFTLVSQDISPLQLSIRYREGLKAKARINPANPNEPSTIEVGQLVQEAVRIIPQNVGLTVALDGSLERIERVDATSAFSSIPHVSTSVVAGEQFADCLFGHVASPRAIVAREESDSTLGIPIKPSYGLFSPGLEPIPNTSGEAGEAVKTSINRLTPKLKTLLAAKLLRLTANEGSSRLGVKATLELIEPSEQVLIQHTTIRAPWSAPATSVSPVAPKEWLLNLPISSSIQYKIHNYSDAPIYFILLGIDPSGGAIVFLPPRTSTNPNQQGSNRFTNQVIAPGETKTIPPSDNPVQWVIQSPPGLVETQLIFSRAAFTETLATLSSAKLPGSERIITLPDPLEVAKAVLQDLHQASTNGAEAVIPTPDSLTLDVNAWATLTFIYQVV